MPKETKNKKYYIFEMNMNILNILSLVLFGLAMLLSFLIAPKTADLNNINLVVLLVFYVGYMFLHEILHSIGYVLNGASFKQVVYRAYLEKGALYCLCKQDISKKNILISIMFPFIFIGLITYVIAIALDLPTLLYLSILNISGCVGDFIIFFYLIKLNKDIEFTEFDNPIQFAIRTSADVSKIKHFGLNFIKETTIVSRNSLKKISVSKGSIIITLVLIVFLILNLIV